MKPGLWMLVAVLACSPLQAQRADYYVAPDGSDAGPGSEQAPFATLARARDAVREWVDAGLQKAVTVLLRGGTYYVPEGVTFGPQDSGTEAFSITYMAYPGDRARLVGGVMVGGWSSDETDILVADLPEGVLTRQVFEGGRRLALARDPDQGYYRMEGPVEGRGKTQFTYRADDLDLRGVDLQGARVFLWPGHDWFSQDKPVAGVDGPRRIVQMTGDQGYDMRPGNRYFLYNVRAFLDRPGECYVDGEAGRLWLWPASGERVEVSTAENVIAVRGTASQPVRNLHFAGLDISMAEGDAVLFEGVEDCSVRYCLIENARQDGVGIHGAARRIRVYGNEIRQHGQHGVSLQGLGPPGPDVNTDHIVDNNHIHHCGRLVGHGCGVRIGQSGKNRIIHNHIHHMPRYGTTIKGIRYQALREQVDGVSFAKRHDFLHSRQNLIAYNHIHDVNMDSQDTGAMESWGPGRDNVYDHNLIHDTGNDQFNLQSGIYLDDASDYFTVTNNIIYNVVGTGGDQCIFVKGIGNRIENNVLIVGPTNVAAIRSMTMGGERTDGHQYTRNIIYFDPPPAPPAGAFGQRLRDLHAVGTTLGWEVDIPARGDYALWLRYTTSVDMGGKTDLSVDGGEPLPLVGLTSTGGWNHWEWRQVGVLSLEDGTQQLTWVNRDGGGIDLDALALCDDAQWRPEGIELADAPPGKHLVLIQAECSPNDRRAAYGFINWSENRIGRADSNLFWNGGREVMVEGGPGSGPLRRWQELGFDAASDITDPLFMAAPGRDFRLYRDSPALDLGFQPIEVDNIGLQDDFPKRLTRD